MNPPSRLTDSTSTPVVDNFERGGGHSCTGVHAGTRPPPSSSSRTRNAPLRTRASKRAASNTRFELDRTFVRCALPYIPIFACSSDDWLPLEAAPDTSVESCLVHGLVAHCTDTSVESWLLPLRSTRKHGGHPPRVTRSIRD